MGRRVLSSPSPHSCPAPPSPHPARSGQCGVMMAAPQVFVGSDVAKGHLAIALWPTGERWAVTNDAPGMAALVAGRQAAQPTLIVLEAPGGSHRAVVAALAAAALPLVVMNPRQVRDCAQATGQLSNPAVLDARAWPPVPRRCDLRRARCPTRRRQSCAPSWRGGGNSSRGGPPSRTAWKTHGVACGPRSRPLLPGSSSAWRPWRTTWTPRSGRAPSGASARPFPAVAQAWGRCGPGRWGSTSRRWALSAASASPPWSASRRSIGTVAPCGGPARPWGVRACAGYPVHAYPRGRAL